MAVVAARRGAAIFLSATVVVDRNSSLRSHLPGTCGWVELGGTNRKFVHRPASSRATGIESRDLCADAASTKS